MHVWLRKGKFLKKERKKKKKRKKSSGKSHFLVNPDGEKNKCHLFGRHVTEPFVPSVFCVGEAKQKGRKIRDKRGKREHVRCPSKRGPSRCRDVTVAEKRRDSYFENIQDHQRLDSYTRFIANFDDRGEERKGKKR